MTKRVLLVDDDADIRDALGQTLELAELAPVSASAFVVAKDHIDARFDGVIVTDIRMAGRDGFYLLDYVQKIDPELPVILLTGEADVPMAVRAMAAGAFDFLEKPCAPQDFLTTVHKALAARGAVLDARRQKLALDSGDAAARMLFGQSPQAEGLRERVRVVARTSAEVLVTGEAGSGTAKIAEVIHLLSKAASAPFVKRAAVSLDVIALSEAFDAAKGGTLYLDEVAMMPPSAQFTLLQKLEESTETRVIAATTRDIDGEVATGAFNADLFHRLDMMRVRIPSLRERAEDIPVLFQHYVAQACEQANLPAPEITNEVVARLMAQDWPGNARSLMKAAMQFVMGIGDGDPQAEQGLVAQLAQVERSLIVAALRRNVGRAGDTAKDLQLPRKTFYDKLGKYGLKAEDFRA